MAEMSFLDNTIMDLPIFSYRVFLKNPKCKLHASEKFRLWKHNFVWVSSGALIPILLKFNNQSLILQM